MNSWIIFLVSAIEALIITTVFVFMMKENIELPLHFIILGVIFLFNISVVLLDKANEILRVIEK